MKEKFFDLQRFAELYNYNTYSLVSGTSSNDSIRNYAGGVTVQGYAGDDYFYSGVKSDYTIKSSWGNVTLDGGEGNDTIYNDDPHVSINGGAGKDKIISYYWDVTMRGGAGNDTLINDNGEGKADSVLVDGGADNDCIINTGDFATLLGGAGNDSIENYNVIYSNGDILFDSIGNNVLINGGAGNDSIYNESDSVTVDGGDGNDYIENNGDGHYASILSGKGNDTIWNGSSNVTINTGDGNDSIYNGGGPVTINAGAGNDSIANSAAITTINAGKGNDIISLGSDATDNLIKYASGDGNDSIVGFNTSSTLKIGDGKGDYSSTKSGSDIIVTVGTGKITLKGAASLSKVNIAGTLVKAVNINNSKSNTVLTGTSYNDTITNSGQNVTISGGAGNDTIQTTDGSSFSVNGGDGNDRISISGGYSTISGGAGNDYIRNYGSFSTISGGDGNDTLDIWTSDELSINGGAGNDLMIFHYVDDDNTIVGGKGNDTISLVSDEYYPMGREIRYSSGDGNDIIYNFNEDDTLIIGGGTGTYSSTKSSSDIIVTVGTGKITLKGAATLETVNIEGQEINSMILTGTSGADNFENEDDDVKIKALAGNDYIWNAGSKVSMDGGDDADTFYNFGLYSTIIGGKGNDSVLNSSYTNTTYKDDEPVSTETITADYVMIDVGEGNDSVYNIGNNVTIEGGEGNDFIENDGYKVTINGGAGNDSIKNWGDSVSIAGGAGNDSIYNKGSKVTISGGDGIDSIFSSYVNDCSINAGIDNDLISLESAWHTTVDAGAGNDTITMASRTNGDSINGGAGNDVIRLSYSYEKANTIVGGTGNDTIYGATDDSVGNLYKYSSGDGNDKIYNWNSVDTLQIGGGTGSYSSQKSGSDIIVTVGDGKITLVGVSSANIKGTKVSKLVTLTSGNDIYSNSVSGATISALAGNDSISNSASSVSINAGDGDDTVKTEARSVTVVSGAGNDSIENAHDEIKIYGGNGNDFIYNNTGTYVTIDAGAGNDTINNYSGVGDISINGGAGNDLISLNSSWGKMTVKGGTGNDKIYGDSVQEYGIYSVLYQYSSGDGNDKIYNWNSVDTLQIGDGTGSYSSQKSGSDIIVTVGTGKVTLVGVSSANIKGKKVNTNTWKINGTTATYGTSSNTLITLKNLKSGLKVSDGKISGVSLNDKVVTLSKDVLGTNKVTLTGNGYTLALASGVPKSSTKKAWSKTGTYNQTTTAGYTLASDSKSISYTKSATKTLITLKGLKSGFKVSDGKISGVSLSGTKITLSKAVLGTSKVTVSDGYTLALASGVPKPSTKKAWSLSKKTATYKQTKTAGYTLASDSKSISYTAAANKTLATVNGVEATKGFTVNDKTIKLATSSLSNKVSVNGSYSFEFDSSYKNATITGSSSNDTIKNAGSKISIVGGKGNDSIVSSGNDVTIRGGAGNDTLTGGKGKKDTFVYANGGGNDVITNYETTDIIRFESGTTVSKVTVSGSDVVFTAGSGKITVKGGKDKTITYFESGKELVYPEKKSSEVEYNAKGTSATLKDTYIKDSFEPNDYSTYKDILATINAAAVEQPLKITGNKKANKITGTNEDDTIKGGIGGDIIFGGDGNDKIYGDIGNDSLWGGADDDSLWGDEGNDTLTGGDGDDTFIYKSGDGKDTIDGFETRDIIIILDSNVGNPNVNASGDVIYKIDNGLGQLTIKNAKDKYIQPFDGKGNRLPVYNPNS